MKMPESPQCGDFVRVRTRRWLVEGEGSAGDGLDRAPCTGMGLKENQRINPMQSKLSRQTALAM